MKKYLLIKADTNDGDYIDSRNEITDEELAIILPVIKAIKEFDDDPTIKYQKYNWWEIGRNSYREQNKEQYQSPKERYLDTGKITEEAFNYFSDFLPSMGEYPIHTIESIELIEVVNETKLL